MAIRVRDVLRRYFEELQDGRSQRAAAKALGISPALVNLIMSGKRAVSLATIDRLAAQVPLSDLLHALSRIALRLEMENEKEIPRDLTEARTR